MAMRDQISVKMPQELLDEIDLELKRSGYSSRSDFVKAATRHYIDFLYQKRKDMERWGETSKLDLSESGELKTPLGRI